MKGFMYVAAATIVAVLAGVTTSTAEEAEAPTASVSLPEMVVTATRSEEARVNLPQSADIITSQELEDSTGFFFTDRIKKNTSVDVIDFGGGLANIGIRGFRPDLHGINPRLLTLIDGRPAGVTDSFGGLVQDGIERVEVLKGPASSLYGPSAMSGVVNIITRKSSGRPTGSFQIGGGSFGTFDVRSSLGGSLATFADFDVSASYTNQLASFHTGRGLRPHTDFEIYSGRTRLGFNLGQRFRLDFSADTYQSNRLGTPGGVSFGQDNVGQRSDDNIGGDVTLSGEVGKHVFQLKGYGLRQATDFFSRRIEPGSFFRSHASDVRYAGVQAQDAWTLSDRLKLIYGAEYQRITSESRSFGDDGTRLGPFSPIQERETTGVFLESLSSLFGERLILTAGGRFDFIDTTTKNTPFRPDFTPGSASFTEFNPRGGVVYKFWPGWRFHATAGRAFIAPEGADVAGFVDQMRGMQRVIARGNPDLNPESSISVDFGVGYTADLFAADLTYFRTEVTDRITTRVITDTPTLRETTRVNASSADISGLEGMFTLGPGRLRRFLPGLWTLSGTFTWIIEAEEKQPAPTGRVPILNVAEIKANLGLTWSYSRRVRIHVNTRYMGERPAQDFSNGLRFTNGRGGIFDLDAFTVVDAVARFAVTPRNELELAIDNLFDENYSEAADYPRPGLALYARYRFVF